MKYFLILLSSITTLTITNNTFAIFNQNTYFTNNLQTNNNNTLLFNNKYGYLSITDWITNQSTADNKFYSYDSKHADYQLSSGINAKNVFFVDNDGKLQYDSKLVLEKDKTDIENTKQEMISYRKITTMKSDSLVHYSFTEYSQNYFIGDNNWQYLQQGGFEKHIDISQQAGADKVEHSNSLSETLGLYYISKSIYENKISQKIGNNLSQYFINQSSLKDKLNDKLLNKIINLIVKNNKVYDFIKKLSFTNDDKNFSLNFIFDNNNDLIEIYYIEWKKITNIQNNINYHFYDNFNGFVSSWTDESNIYSIINWTKYAKTWNNFIRLYPNFIFNDSELLITYINGNNKLSNLSNSTVNINNEKTPLFFLENNYDGGSGSFQRIKIILYIWHDNQNIYWQWYGYNYSSLLFIGSSYSISLKNLIFIS
ncbi:hypothetical protein [Spiroplasma endosymbiont of Danaus chrysippus]|uniref:hypothetical protein n=1 Tax=Spiroplasma endosymbiont of Danaus chrysippus TaxID=2691041 RepID=UPI00157B6970|nr:hypothetical protein [Spiroplasma endosymbiont of Danaus chrysippus]